MAPRMASNTVPLMGWSGARASTQSGRKSWSSSTGNSKSTDWMISVTARWLRSRQLTARQVTSDSSASWARRAWAPSESGRAELRRMRKGLPSSLSSEITRASASR